MHMLEISIPLKPLSYNNSKTFSFKSKRFFKNKKTMQYEVDFEFLMEQIKIPLLEFCSEYDDRKHAFKISCFFYTPEKEFFTKDGRISARGQDLDNLLKINIDLLFKTFKKFNQKINDKQITQIYCEKIPSSGESKMIFHIERVIFPLVFSR